MRSGIADREDAIERKFQHDSELAFKVKARRNRLFGFWAGQQLGLEGSDLESYATRIVIFSVQSPLDEALVNMVKEAFDGGNVTFSKHQIEKQLLYFQDDAQKEFSRPLSNSLAG